MVVHGGKSAASGECSSARAKAMRRLRHRKEAQLVSRVIEGGKGATCWKRRQPCEGFFGLEANQFKQKRGLKGRKRKEEDFITTTTTTATNKTCLGDLGERCACQARKAAKEAKCAGR